MHKKKKKIIFKLNMNSENANDKCTLDLDVLRLNPCGEDEKQSCRSFINPNFSTQ